MSYTSLLSGDNEANVATASDFSKEGKHSDPFIKAHDFLSVANTF